MKWSGENKIIEDQGNVRENLQFEEKSGKIEIIYIIGS